MNQNEIQLIENTFKDSIKYLLRLKNNNKYPQIKSILLTSFITLKEIIDELDSVGFVFPIPHETKDSYLKDFLLLEIVANSNNINCLEFSPQQLEELTHLFSKIYYHHIKTYSLLTIKESRDSKDYSYKYYMQVKKFTNAIAACYLTRMYPHNYDEILNTEISQTRLIKTLTKTIE